MGLSQFAALSAVGRSGGVRVTDPMGGGDGPVTGKAMMIRALRQGIELRLVEPSKPNQNAYVESFNGRLREECLNEHWFTSLDHAKRVIETWRREYNEERDRRDHWAG